MYAVTGITGKVGGAVARALLGAGQPVRAVVLRLQFTGSETDEPDLAALFNALGGRVRLLQGGVERIQGHALGQLLLAVSGSPHSADELRKRAGNWAQQAEVLGYVV